MNIAKPRDRIWFNMLNTERMSRYYSRRYESLKKQHLIFTFIVAVVPVVAIAILQLDLKNKEGVASLILIAAALLEIALIHFGSGGDIKACKVMGNQNAELAKHWRHLWVDQHRPDVLPMIETLESISTQAMSESISHFDWFWARDKLYNKCAEETNSDFKREFGFET